MLVLAFRKDPIFGTPLNFASPSDVDSSVWPIIRDGFPFAYVSWWDLALADSYRWHLVIPGTSINY